MFERRLFHALFATADQKEGMDAFVTSARRSSSTSEEAGHLNPRRPAGPGLLGYNCRLGALAQSVRAMES